MDRPWNTNCQTSTTHTTQKATVMTRITLALATVLSLAFTPLAAQETNCDGWMSSDREVRNQFWEAVTLETVADCLNSDSDVNARTENGYTPLHFAAALADNPDVLTVLLDAGADGTAVNSDGETPFDLAKDNEALVGKDAYWALNEARFK